MAIGGAVPPETRRLSSCVTYTTEMLYRIALLAAFALFAAVACKDSGEDAPDPPSSRRTANPGRATGLDSAQGRGGATGARSWGVGVLHERATGWAFGGGTGTPQSTGPAAGRRSERSSRWATCRPIPGKGRDQNSASVYADTSGASQAFKTRSEAARTNDWPANYTDLDDVQTAEVARHGRRVVLAACYRVGPSAIPKRRRPVLLPRPPVLRRGLLLSTTYCSGPGARSST